MVYCKQSSKCAKIEPKINGNMSFILPVTENKLNVAATLHRILNNTNLGFMKDTGRLYRDLFQNLELSLFNRVIEHDCLEFTHNAVRLELVRNVHVLSHNQLSERSLDWIMRRWN